jgi:hypothetical protein
MGSIPNPKLFFFRVVCPSHPEWAWGEYYLVAQHSEPTALYEGNYMLRFTTTSTSFDSG